MSKFSDTFRYLGRTVSFHPGLRKLKISTPAVLLLSQFLYWTPKTDDGWFYKSVEELEEETGLSYDEQATARTKLKERGFTQEKYARGDHQLWFKVNLDAINDAWEVATGEKPDAVAVPEKKVLPKHEGKDVVDAYVDLMYMPGAKKETVKLGIESKLAVRLHINPSGKRWEDFISYAADRWIKDNQNIDTFIDYALANRFDPIYWTPEKMKTVWPTAFIQDAAPALDSSDGFVVKLPPIETKVIAPMPSGLLRKNQGE